MKSHTLKTPVLQESSSISLCFLTDFRIPFDEIRTLLPNLNCALVNSCLVFSLEQLTSAIMKVLVAGAGMKTRSKYTELLYSLSPSTNVTESLKTFGLLEGNTVAIAVRFNCEDGEAFAQELQEKLNCTVLDYDASLFETFSDFESIKKTYKLSTTKPSLEICSIISSKGI